MRNNIVTDNGLNTIKCGLSGENFPSVIMPTIIEFPKFGRYNIFNNGYKYKIGIDAIYDSYKIGTKK